MVGLHWFDMILYLMFLVIGVAAWIVGFTWVRTDADRRGQPGILWAVLTLPFGWLPILAYLIVRAVSGASGPQRP